MDKPTLYMETTIPSYLLAEPSRDLVACARQEITRTWWRRDHARFAVSISPGVLEEANQGDRRAARVRREFLDQFRVLDVTPEVLRLTQLYLQKRIVPLKKPGDAAHLAFASAYQVQFLCTWNFKHIANAFALHKLRELNEKEGLFTPQVCTPEELLGE
jgi:hypothetical protein